MKEQSEMTMFRDGFGVWHEEPEPKNPHELLGILIGVGALVALIIMIAFFGG